MWLRLNVLWFIYKKSGLKIRDHKPREYDAHIAFLHAHEKDCSTSTLLGVKLHRAIKSWPLSLNKTRLNSKIIIINNV